MATLEAVLALLVGAQSHVLAAYNCTKGKNLTIYRVHRQILLTGCSQMSVMLSNQGNTVCQTALLKVCPDKCLTACDCHTRDAYLVTQGVHGGKLETLMVGSMML